MSIFYDSKDKTGFIDIFQTVKQLSSYNFWLSCILLMNKNWHLQLKSIRMADPYSSLRG